VGLFSFIGGLLGAGAEKKAVSKATQAQVDAYNHGIDEQRREYDQTRTDFQPYLNAGTSALPQMEDLLGLNGPDKASAAIDALKQSPIYQSLYNNGQEAILANGAATGGIRGGNQQGALADFGRDTLSSVIQNQLSSLGGLAGLGEGATNQVSGFGQASTDNIIKLLSSIGGAQASGDLTKGGLTAGMWNSAGQFGDSLVSAAFGAFPGMGGGGSGGMPSFLSKLF
jgi:hypothetical protein